MGSLWPRVPRPYGTTAFDDCRSTIAFGRWLARRRRAHLERQPVGSAGGDEKVTPRDSLARRCGGVDVRVADEVCGAALQLFEAFFGVRRADGAAASGRARRRR